MLIIELKPLFADLIKNVSLSIDLKIALAKCWWGPIVLPNHASSDILITKLVFENSDSNYLKTIYELKESFHCDLILEIPTLWDFRDNDNGKKNNKIGLILNIVSLKIH